MRRLCKIKSLPSPIFTFLMRRRRLAEKVQKNAPSTPKLNFSFFFIQNRWINAKKKFITSVACHPTEETVIIGDETGKIFIYYKLFYTKNPTNTLCHWHHNPVEALSFSESGSLFYSGGAERVLIGWDYNGKEKVSCLPRHTGSIVHIVVSADNQKIAISSDDNGK